MAAIHRVRARRKRPRHAATRCRRHHSAGLWRCSTRPDIDSVVETNRELAAQLLAAADLWLFVTTAARYADAVPWDFLTTAAERSTAVAVVLDRVAPASVEDITGHLAHMLVGRGLGDSPLFAVPESPVDRPVMLPPEVYSPIQTWLTALAADAGARAAVVRRTLEGAVHATIGADPRVRRRDPGAVRHAVELRTAAEAAYAVPSATSSRRPRTAPCCAARCSPGGQEFVGTGELLKGCSPGSGGSATGSATA